MRLIGILSNENDARKVGSYLSKEGIANRCEVSFDPHTNHMSYQIWVHDEDSLASAAKALQEFKRDPSNPRFEAPFPPELPPTPQSPEVEKNSPRRFGTRLTTFFLSLCALIFFLNSMQELPLRQEGLSESTFLMTPIQAALMYDLPPAFEKLEKVIEKYELEGGKGASNLGCGGR